MRRRRIIEKEMDKKKIITMAEEEKEIKKTKKMKKNKSEKNKK